MVAFGLPDSYRIHQSYMQSGEAQELWSPRASALGDSVEYVAQRLRAYRGQSEYELRSQYRDLMLQWARLCYRRDAQELVLLSRTQPQHKQAAAGGQRASMQPSTGDQEHGSAVVGPCFPQASDRGSSLQASQQSGTCSNVKL